MVFLTRMLLVLRPFRDELAAAVQATARFIPRCLMYLIEFHGAYLLFSHFLRLRYNALGRLGWYWESSGGLLQ